ncbi:MAG: c-type cytochrome [Xanthobacteraceae bacterium]
MDFCRAHVALAALALVLDLLLGQSVASAASAEKGQALFLKYGCWQCHGTLGQGAATGPRLAPDPLPFDALANFVRTSSGQMPPYRQAVLPDADLADIYAYLQSVAKPPDPRSVPLLNR